MMRLCAVAQWEMWLLVSDWLATRFRVIDRGIATVNVVMMQV